MHNNQIIMAAIAGLASTAAANINLQAIDALRNISPAVVPRQDLGDQCLNDIMQIVQTVPQPPQELVEWAEEEAKDLDVTDTKALAELCTTPADFPTSLTSAMSAYETKVVSWINKESSAFESIISSCSDNEYVKSASGIVDVLTKDPACSSVIASATASLSGADKPTGTGATGASATAGPSATGTGANSQPSQAAAGHNGVVASVLVGAGFLGLTAML